MKDNLTSCILCYTVFTKRNKQHKFCSKRCSKTYQIKKVEKKTEKHINKSIENKHLYSNTFWDESINGVTYKHFILCLTEGQNKNRSLNWCIKRFCHERQSDISFVLPRLLDWFK